ncbi:MAG: hypothetical protein R3E60_06615 [Alphaproteobacteria bacterium]
MVAEGLAGDEARFAEMMTRNMELGMTHSHFLNADGLPAEGHMTSAKCDLAVLALRTMQDFPEFYHYYSEQEFALTTSSMATNPCFYDYLGADGLKTGHTEKLALDLLPRQQMRIGDY